MKPDKDEVIVILSDSDGEGDVLMGSGWGRQRAAQQQGPHSRNACPEFKFSAAALSPINAVCCDQARGAMTGEQRERGIIIPLPQGANAARE